MSEARDQVRRSEGADSMPISGMMMAEVDLAVEWCFLIMSRTQGASPVTSR